MATNNGLSGLRRTSLQQTLSILDPLQTWNWDVIFPNLPGGLVDSRSFSTKALASTIPSSTLEVVSVESRIMKLNWAGRRTYDGTWSCTFIESRDSSTRNMVIGWMEFARSYRKNTGSYKSEYATNAELVMYDDKPMPVQAIRLNGLFPTQVGEISLDASAAAVQYQVTFQYDFLDDIDPSTGALLNRDGLSQQTNN